MTNLLCIDPGRHSAWLVGNYEKDDTNHSQIPDIYMLHCKQESPVDVYGAFYRHGIEMAKDITHIIYEEPFVRSHRAARMQYGMVAIIHLIASQTQSCEAVWPIHPSWIKKHATGKGNAKKEEMISSAQHYVQNLNNKDYLHTSYLAQLIEQLESSDAADAFWIYRYFVDEQMLKDHVPFPKQELTYDKQSFI